MIFSALLSMITSRFFQLLYSLQGQKKYYILGAGFDMAAQIHSLEQIKFTSHTLSPAELKMRVALILDCIQKHPKAYELVQQAFLDGPFRIEFTNTVLATGGSCYYQSRMIAISSSIIDPYELIDTVIFEICYLTNEQLKNQALEENALREQCENYMNGWKIFLMKHPNAIDYATYNEKDEFYSNEKAAEILQTGVQQFNWPMPSEGKMLRRSYKHWSKYWEQTLMPNNSNEGGLSHVQGYMKDYYDICLKIIDSNFSLLVLNCETAEILEEKTQDLFTWRRKLVKEKAVLLRDPAKHAIPYIQKTFQENPILDLPKKPITFTYNSIIMAGVLGATATSLWLLNRFSKG